MKVGEYFRTPFGTIGKITKIPKHNQYDDDGFYLDGEFVMCGKEIIKSLKSTNNIIDLIEVGDYVNGYKVTSKDQFLGFGNYDWYMTNDEIKSIVTKEQFESMEYKVGE